MGSLAWLTANSAFPAPAQALDDPPGLIAAGGDLSPARLMSAYQQGIFPWFMNDSPLLWWSPDPRCVFTPSSYQPSRRLVRQRRQQPWRFSVNRCFTQVIQGCAAPRDYADDTWITADMQAAYAALHRLGWAHSIEIWFQGQLVGGLYGVSVGRVFCAESMYSRQSNASKMAVWALMSLGNSWHWPVVDAQMENPHLMLLGAELWSRQQYLTQLQSASTQPLPDWRQAELVLANQGFIVS